MLAVRDAYVAYGEIPAVRGVDLDVGAGQAVAVLGRNGAGKSSLLRAIAGVAPLQSGSVTFDGTDVSRMPAARRAKAGLVLVPEGRRLFPHMTVHDNLVVGAYSRGLTRHEIEAEIERVTLHLPTVRSRLGQRAGSLSGGEQQLVAVARALMADPRVLMIDEPSLGLAPIIIDSVYDLFGRLRDEGLTLLVVEQYVEVALGLVQSAVVVAKGEIVLRGAAHDLANSRDLIDAYLSSTEAP